MAGQLCSCGRGGGGGEEEGGGEAGMTRDGKSASEELMTNFLKCVCPVHVHAGNKGNEDNYIQFSVNGF